MHSGERTTRIFFPNKKESNSGLGNHNPLEQFVSIQKFRRKTSTNVNLCHNSFCKFLPPFSFDEVKGVEYCNLNTSTYNIIEYTFYPNLYIE